MSGTSGGMDKRLKIGDTAVAVETLYHDIDGTVYKSDENLLARFKDAVKKNPPTQSVFFGRIATGKKFIKKNNRLNIIEKFDPLTVDMETAAVADVCILSRIPFIAVRSVTDTEDKMGFVTFLRNVSMASHNSCNTVRAFLRQ
jgi:adenosylhomocysteine nucleosidase